MSPVAEFATVTGLVLGVAWVLWKGWRNDPFEEFCNARKLVALREQYEQNDWATSQLIEIKNLPETDPWRATT